jgi:hypothetical protein
MVAAGWQPFIYTPYVPMVFITGDGKIEEDRE